MSSGPSPASPWSKSPAFVNLPVPFWMSPPSSMGISLLSPAPETWEPYSAVEPGNFWVTEESIPDSVAGNGTISKSLFASGGGLGQLALWRRRLQTRKGKHHLLESLAPARAPVLASWLFKSRSASLASSRGSFPSYSADILIDFASIGLS